MRRSLMLVTLACCAVVATPSVVLAQATEPPPERNERESLIAVLDRRIDAYERSIDRLRDTIAAIRSGAPLEGIRERMRQDRVQEANEEGAGEGRPGRGDGDGRGDARDRVRDRAGDGAREDLRERRRGNRGFEPASPEQIERVLAMIEENRPEIARELRTMREENPERFEVAITRIVGFIARDPASAVMMIDLRSADARVEKLRREIAASPERREVLTPELETAVRAAAEARLAFESRMITRERERLDEREQQLETFRADFDALVRERIDAILNGAEPEPGPERAPEGRDRRQRGGAGGT